MSASHDHDARQDAMLRAFERLCSESSSQGAAERTTAREVALALVERALTSERTTRPGPAVVEKRPILARSK